MKQESVLLPMGKYKTPSQLFSVVEGVLLLLDF